MSDTPDFPPPLLRSTLEQWRSDSVVSAGASQDFVRQQSGRVSSSRSNSLVVAPETAAKLAAVELPNYITSIIKDLDWALRELPRRNSFSLAELEALAILIHENLTNESRVYHGVEHIFEVSSSATPLQLLAAFFRDLLRNVQQEYIVSDGETTTEVVNKENRDDTNQAAQDDDDLYLASKVSLSMQEIIARVVGTRSSSTSGYSLYIKQRHELTKREQVVVDVFGLTYANGQEDSSENSNNNNTNSVSLELLMQQHGGLDIFCSALAASYLLRKVLTLGQQAQLAAVIEATIPFRQSLNDQQSLQALYERLEYCNERYSFHYDSTRLVETVQQGADLLNRQVGNMVTNDIALFLAHTWSLLPEENASLRMRALYTTMEYYTAIYKMLNFLSSLRSNNTCVVSFHDVPAQAEVQQFSEQLAINLDLSSLYIKARLLAVAIVVAFAKLTGGENRPKSFFFGDPPEFHQRSDRLGNGLLPLISPSINQDNDTDTSSLNYNAEILDLLCGNRMADTGFDTRNAPLAAYIYKNLGDEMIIDLNEQHCRLDISACEENCWNLLKAIPFDILQNVGHEIGRIAVSRSRRIDRVLDKLQQQQQQ